MMNLAIYAFDEVEALDFAGPYEVFTCASRVSVKHGLGEAPFKVFAVAERMAPVKARAGLALMPDYSCADHPPIDLLVVPGGVVTAELEKPRVLDWIATQAASARITSSVCTGAFLLGAAGLLAGRRVTTHWEDLDDLRQLLAVRAPTARVVDGVRWVDEGALLTSAGISAGIDMSLHLVSRLVSPELARLTARQMDYPWNPQPD